MGEGLTVTLIGRGVGPNQSMWGVTWGLVKGVGGGMDIAGTFLVAGLGWEVMMGGLVGDFSVMAFVLICLLVAVVKLELVFDIWVVVAVISSLLETFVVIFSSVDSIFVVSSIV